MRRRWERRIRKQLRRLRGHELEWSAAIAKLERGGVSVAAALEAIMLDTTRSHQERAQSARLLATDGGDRAIRTLLRQFFEQKEKDDLYASALVLEGLNDRRAVAPLIVALLNDTNHHRRHAAARALGWIRRPGRGAARALARCLVDPEQPQPAREEAAESLSYVGNAETIEPLVSVLRDPDVRIRFWAVFGLGGRGRADPHAVRALESVLDDPAIPPGNWWSVGKEALAMLAEIPGYQLRLATEVQRILADPSATAEDRRWADYYRS